MRLQEQQIQRKGKIPTATVRQAAAAVFVELKMGAGLLPRTKGSGSASVPSSDLRKYARSESAMKLGGIFPLAPVLSTAVVSIQSASNPIVFGSSSTKTVACSQA
jgi:hypothetical protein